MKFKELSLDDRLLEGIEAIGFEDATPVQEAAIPVILEGKDIIASAQTGTGKTAAFLLPIIHQIIQVGHDNNIKALIIVPTRELAVQIDQQMEGLSYFTSVSSIAVYGGGDGSSFSREKQALSEGADVVIGTPGRLIAHLNLGYVKVDQLKHLILDEADRMLDMGFHDDLMKIISYLPKKRQNLLFSATMPPKIRELARKILHEPEEINIAVSKPAERIFQAAFIVYDNQKIPLATHLLKAKKLQSVIVFCSTKSAAKQLAKELKALKFSAEDIHSDLEQTEREHVLRDFKNRKINILVATDIMSRGIDVEDIELVINYDVPNDGEDYIHRIGRTARAASKGVAFTFVNEKEQRKFQDIETLLGSPVPKGKLPAALGEGPEYRVHKGRSGGQGRSGGGRRKKSFHKKK
ncbi:ATP-dependent RNA helicase [Fulvivirga imtechensis AK7]|uniref:ATP-dependent RNA helicase n=1 Tax=Fulvivirga imtechensis AK7 TaxID=1237149 RepID=L8JWR0_9BACT|nr:DEAD/DEAH box helicase [Fulvivirga imtechensis]ELR73496.1 ATP-dependent RNA helicase [Fulvivirga imtechensis AK7]